MVGHGERYSRKHAQAAEALLTARTLEQAAEMVNINVRTLKNWLRRPDFQAVYRDLKRQVNDVSSGRVQQLAGKAADALERLLESDREAVVAKVALGILAHVRRAVELDELAEQLAELRVQVDALKRQQHGHGRRYGTTG
jgi:sensor histidine kinase regulating citrate/malate metabolism